MVYLLFEMFFVFRGWGMVDLSLNEFLYFSIYFLDLFVYVIRIKICVFMLKSESNKIRLKINKIFNYLFDEIYFLVFLLLVGFVLGLAIEILIMLCIGLIWYLCCYF